MPSTQTRRRHYDGGDRHPLCPQEIIGLRLTSGRGSSFDDGYVRDEAVTPPSDGLYETWTRRRITECIPNPVDRFIDPVVEIDEGLGGPQSLAKLFPGHRLT